MKRLTIWLMLLFMLLSLSGCASSWRQTVPGADIIYLPRAEINQLGFVNADGSNASVITLGKSAYKRLGRPVWSADGRFLYGLTGLKSLVLAAPAYWDTQTGKLKYCDRDIPFFIQVEGTGNLENPAEVLIRNYGSIWRMNLDTCEYQMIVELAPGAQHIDGFSFNPATQELLYGFYSYTSVPIVTNTFHVIKYNLSTGDKATLAEGLKPSWSPDGTRIAYLGREGIYTMDANGENQTLIQREFYYRQHDFHPFGIDAPIPRWSPDGAWLLYTGCGQADCDAYNLYKVPAQGGAAELILTDIYAGSASWKP